RAGDAVDPKPSLGVVMAERPPQPRRLNQKLEPRLLLEGLVAGRGLVAADRVGDVRVDVEGGGPGRPVARAFLAGDRPPRKRRPGEAELLRTLARQVERRVPPAERVA